MSAVRYYQHTMAENSEMFQREASNREEVFQLVDEIIKPSITRDEVQRKYGKWAAHYDKVGIAKWFLE